MISRKFIFIILIMAIVLVLSILSSLFQKKDKEILIFAAVSLSEPLEEIKDIFYEENNISLMLNFGGSQTLASQINRGADPEIFIPAGISPYNFINDKNINVVDFYVLLYNKLVFASGKKIDNWEQKNIKELVVSDYINRISIADPELAPAGEYTIQALNNMGVMSDIEKKIVKTKNVRDAVNHMRLGLSDGVFAYNTDFNNYEGNYSKKNISENLYNEIQYPIVVLENSYDVKEFLIFLKNEKIKNIFTKYGFSNP